MKKAKSVLSAFMATVILLTFAPLNGFAADFAADVNDADNSQSVSYKIGDIIEFGSYPQSEVTDVGLIDSLNECIVLNNWNSYGYYSGNGSIGSMQQSDYMFFQDITYDDMRYRAVKFQSYRPTFTYGSSNADNSLQDDNGYLIDTVYFFKFEPIKWRVLDPYDGLVMCESIIDSQAFSDTIYEKDGSFYSNSECDVISNRYLSSSIRNWLNSSFYNFAFSEEEKERILPTSIESTFDSDTCADVMNKFDKLFLMSGGMARYTNYEFSSDYSFYDSKRQAKGSDYAQSQGLWVKKEESIYEGNSYWWIRKEGTLSNNSYYVSSGGLTCNDDTNYSKVYNTSSGIRPLCRLKNIYHDNTTVSIEAGKIYSDTDFIEYGSPMFFDSLFEYSNNSMVQYGSNRDSYSMTKVSKDQDCPTNSQYMIELSGTGKTSPGLGGYYQLVQERSGGVFYHVIIAKIPVGYEIDANSNTLGVGGQINRLTSTKGTGDWALYVFEIKYGLNFQSAPWGYTSGHIYIKIGNIELR